MNDETPKIPRHVGYIMDGNRRWARSHGIPTYEGHLAGYNTIKDVLRATVEAGVEYVSFYAFSTENWKRDEGEVSAIMKLIMRLYKTDFQELINENIRVKILGRDDGLSKDIIKAAREAEEKSAHCTRATVLICFNYGGHAEIVDAVRTLVDKGAAAKDITEATIAENIYGPDMPPVDMIVRTGGEQRLSGFMLWRSTYSELMFIDKFWPAIETRDVTAIIKEYGKRQRRFGN